MVRKPPELIGINLIKNIIEELVHQPAAGIK